MSPFNEDIAQDLARILQQSDRARSIPGGVEVRTDDGQWVAIDQGNTVQQNQLVRYRRRRGTPNARIQEVHVAIVISVSTTVFDPDTGTTSLPLRGFVKISDKPLFELPFGFPLTFTATDTVVVPIAKNDWVFQFLTKASRWKDGVFTTITGTSSGGAYTFPANSFSDYLLNTSGIDAIDCVVYQQTASATGYSVPTTDPFTCPWNNKWSKIDSGDNPIRWYSVLTGVDVYAKPDAFRGSSGVESDSVSSAKKRIILEEQDVVNLGFTLDTPIASTGGTPFGTFGSPTETSNATIQVTEISGGIVTRTTLGIARQRAILIT